MRSFHRIGGVLLVLVMPNARATQASELPAAIAAPGESVIYQAHAEGAQIYQCTADAGQPPTWHFREPIASLLRDGATVGRHYAGPTWEIDGSAVVGKVAGTAPGYGPHDIPWLKLTVSSRRGDGPLQDVTTVQRINTAGGKIEGSCPEAGAFHAEPYSADYVFLRKAP